MLACLDRGSRTLDVVRAQRRASGSACSPPTRSRWPARSPARRRTPRSSARSASTSATGSRSSTARRLGRLRAARPAPRRRPPDRGRRRARVGGDGGDPLVFFGGGYRPLGLSAGASSGHRELVRACTRRPARAGRRSAGSSVGARRGLRAARLRFAVSRSVRPSHHRNTPSARKSRSLSEISETASRRSEERAAGARRAQREDEDDQRRDGHDPGLAADDRERERALALARAGRRSRAPRARARRRRRGRASASSETTQRQHAVEVVQAVGGLVAESSEERPEQRPGGRPSPARRAAAYQKQTLGLAAQPGDRRPRRRRRGWRRARRRRRPGGRSAIAGADQSRVANPPRRSDFPLADAEKHYVATCHKVGYNSGCVLQSYLPVLVFAGLGLDRRVGLRDAERRRSGRKRPSTRDRRPSRTSAGCRATSRAPSASGSAST